MMCAFGTLLATPAEIAASRNAELNGNETGLVSYYKFNEGSGQTAGDSAGSNDGTLGNTAGVDVEDPTWGIGAGPATAPQGPATEAVITVLADGRADFDATTFDPNTGTNVGQDADANNGVVRNVDFVTYSVETSLNDADDTNLLSTVTLNNKAKWSAVPNECRTQELHGASVIPDSEILDTTGDGLEDTLICNLGDQTEGTKIRFKPVAQAVGNNGDAMQVSVVSSSDNNVNTGCDPLDGDNQVTNSSATTQCQGPKETIITAEFGIGLTKDVRSFADEDLYRYRPAYFAPDAEAPGSEEGRVVQWHISLNYQAGSELVQDDGAGRQSFTIQDTWVGAHSNDPSVVGDNAAGDFDDKIKMYGDITGDPTDNCDFPYTDCRGYSNLFTS